MLEARRLSAAAQPSWLADRPASPWRLTSPDAAHHTALHAASQHDQAANSVGNHRMRRAGSRSIESPFWAVMSAVTTAIVLSASIASAIVRVAMGGTEGELSRVRLRTHQPAAFNLARAGRRRPRLLSRKLQLHRI